jgi:transcriptional regulator, luxR family domain protein
LALCTVSISSGENMDRIEITHQYSRGKWIYNPQTQKWKKDINVIELSEEEKEVLRLVAQGFTMDKISDSMYKSIDTVKGYRKHIFEKFGTNSITQAVAYAINNKLI